MFNKIVFKLGTYMILKIFNIKYLCLQYMNNIHSKMPQNISQNFPYLSARYSKLLTVLTINIF